MHDHDRIALAFRRCGLLPRPSVLWLKDNATTEIVDCIRSVAAGDEYISPTLSSFLIRRRTRATSLAEQKPALDQLTPAERRILRLIADGLTSREIPGQLG